MLERPKDRATYGPTGLRRAPKRRDNPNAAVKPFRGPIYAPSTNPEKRPFLIANAKQHFPIAPQTGKPLGWRHDEIAAARAEAQAKAEETIAAVADKLSIENDKARDALEFAITVVRDETVNVKDRIAAARLTLDFTQPKPASKTELEIKKAEDFLDALAEEDKKDDTGTA